MGTTVRARYDGKVFQPLEPVDLPADTELDIVLQRPEPMSFIETALSLNLDGPEDWSENLKEYLAAQRADTHE